MKKLLLLLCFYSYAPAYYLHWVETADSRRAKTDSCNRAFAVVGLSKLNVAPGYSLHTQQEIELSRQIVVSFQEESKLQSNKDAAQSFLAYCFDGEKCKVHPEECMQEFQWFLSNATFSVWRGYSLDTSNLLKKIANAALQFSFYNSFKMGWDTPNWIAVNAGCYFMLEFVDWWKKHEIPQMFTLPSKILFSAVTAHGLYNGAYKAVCLLWMIHLFVTNIVYYIFVQKFWIEEYMAMRNDKAYQNLVSKKLKFEDIIKPYLRLDDTFLDRTLDLLEHI